MSYERDRNSLTSQVGLAGVTGSIADGSNRSEGEATVRKTTPADVGLGDKSELASCSKYCTALVEVAASE